MYRACARAIRGLFDVMRFGQHSPPPPRCPRQTLLLPSSLLMGHHFFRPLRFTSKFIYSRGLMSYWCAGRWSPCLLARPRMSACLSFSCVLFGSFFFMPPFLSQVYVMGKRRSPSLRFVPAGAGRKVDPFGNSFAREGKQHK